MAVGQPAVRPVKTQPSAPQFGAGSDPDNRYVPDAQGRPIMPGDMPPRTAPKAGAQVTPLERPRDIEVHTLTELPSRFKGYGGIDYIEICAFTLGEMKYLASHLTSLQVIDSFKPKIRNIDIMELSVYDFYFITNFINVMTTKCSDWIMQISCGSCGENFEYRTDKDGMFVFDDLEIPELPVIVTLGGTEFKFDIPRVKDIYTSRELGKKYPDSDSGLITLACQARISMLPQTALKILEGLTDVDDRDLVDKLQKLFYHGEKPVSAKCPKCGFEGRYVVGSDITTIKPFREDEGHLDARIKFGDGVSGGMPKRQAV
jgi:hypothetical protein